MHGREPAESVMAEGKVGAQVCGETSCLARVPHLPDALHASPVAAVAQGRDSFGHCLPQFSLGGLAEAEPSAQVDGVDTLLVYGTFTKSEPCADAQRQPFC